MKVAEQRLLLLRALRLDTRARTLSLLNCSSNLASSQEGWQGSTSLCLVKPRKGKAIFVNQTAPRYSADLKRTHLIECWVLLSAVGAAICLLLEDASTR